MTHVPTCSRCARGNLTPIDDESRRVISEKGRLTGGERKRRKLSSIELGSVSAELLLEFSPGFDLSDSDPCLEVISAIERVIRRRTAAAPSHRPPLASTFNRNARY
jgi:hypothetical protein